MVQMSNTIIDSSEDNKMLRSLKHKILCVNQFIYAIGIYTVWRPSKKNSSLHRLNFLFND